MYLDAKREAEYYRTAWKDLNRLKKFDKSAHRKRHSKGKTKKKKKQGKNKNKKIINEPTFTSAAEAALEDLTVKLPKQHYQEFAKFVRKSADEIKKEDTKMKNDMRKASKRIEKSLDDAYRAFYERGRWEKTKKGFMDWLAIITGVRFIKESESSVDAMGQNMASESIKVLKDNTRRLKKKKK